MARFLSVALLSLCYILTAHADIYSASSALSRGDYEAAVAEFTKLADKGDANAQANLGYMYYAGEGVPQDYEKAVYWYRKAATQGNKDAQYNLAVSYAFGEGIKQDLTEAAIWYRRAGEQDHVVSQYSLGISYAYGEGVPQDQKEAARWFKKAAEQGYARAQVHLGSMYHTGEGVEQNYDEAARWYRMAADRGDATAQYNLGAMYRLGKGVEQNYSQAKRWFRQSADQGYAAAQNELASLERSAAANVATRTIQSKPELPTAKETIAESTPVKKAEPIKEKTNEKVAVQKAKVKEPTQTITPEVNEEKKEPLFSVEKEGLLSLDTSELDIVETKTVSQKSEIKKEVIAEVDIPSVEKTVEEKEESVITDTTETKSNISAIHNALGLPANTGTTNTSEEETSSGGFFDKLFSSKKSSEVEAIDENEVAAEVKEDIVLEPKIKKEFITTPRTYPEDVKADELAAIEKTKPVENTIEPISEVEVENETSGGFFDRLFSSNESSEIETIDEDEVVVEVKEEVIPEPKIKKEFITTPRTYPEDVKTDELAAIEKTNIDSDVVENEKTESVTTEEVAEATTQQGNSWGKTASEIAKEAEEKKSSGGLFSAIGNFFSGESKTKEAEINETEVEVDIETEVEVENDEVIIAKLEEPAPVPVTEEIELEQQAEQEVQQYSVHAGRRALTNSDFDEAFKQFKPLADAGDSEAQSHLGSLYYVGKGVNKDLNESYRWYKKAADQGNMDAQYSIANMYLLGEGIEQNNASAAEWYTLASNQGHIAARNNLKSLEKLEALNRENQLKLDAMAAKQKAKEEASIPEIIEEEQEEIATLDEETTTTNAEAIDEEKPGLLGLLGGLFGSKTTENESIKETEVTKETSESEASEVEVVEYQLPKTNIEDESLVIEPLQTLEKEEQLESSNNIASLDKFQTPSSESPNFFNSLFGDDTETNNNETESVELKSDEKIEVINVEAEEIVSVDVEVNIEETEELASESIDTSNEITEEQVDSEKSEGLFGFIGNIFSSEDKNEIDNNNSEAEVSEDIAMLEPETPSETINIADETIVEELTEETSSISAIDSLRPLAIQGDQNSQFKLATLYYSGNSVKQDYSQAALWYRRAAQQGNVDAQYSLGNMFLMGEGVTQNDKQASHWYSLAAEQGHSSAKNNLKSLQALNESETPQPAEIETTNTTQLISLDEESPTESTVLDTTGKSEYEQGLAYAFGDGVAQNDRTAFNLFYEAAEKGYVLAQYKLGVAFAYGEGVRQDQKKAAEWYRKSAEQGYTIAQRNLATMYLSGNGVEQNKVQAFAWYQVVANSGNAMDLRRRDMLKTELTDVELIESQELSKQIYNRLANPSL